MVLKDLLAIAGSPGLYKFIAQGKNAVIVEHLETGKRTSAHGAAKVSSLEDIAVFTDTEEVPLADVFDRIHEKENGAASLSHKSPATELKTYFSEILPDYDRERVYVSDIRKIIQWYNILHSLDLLEKEAEESAEKESSSAGDDAGNPDKDAPDKDAGTDKDRGDGSGNPDKDAPDKDRGVDAGNPDNDAPDKDAGPGKGSGDSDPDTEK